MGLITHIVSLKYAPHVSAAERHYIASSFLALKETCVLPSDFGGHGNVVSASSSGEVLEDSNGKYIVECTGGCNNSPEGFSRGFDHTFILTFRNKKERDFYLDQDPAHQAFKKLLGGKLLVDDSGKPGVWVFDYEAGVFE